ncbi:MAG: hypothetical protein LJE85_00535 [Gammaproteobacteria bacterium]|jgi:hypothetical protein|nr:hypothetical protein [Gammaproteobacteria bacterium]
MSSLQKWALSILVTLIFTSACTSTKLTAVWNDDTYSGGPLKKVMVVAALDNPVNRKIVESALVEELKQNGVEGIASNMTLGDKKLSEVNVIETAKQKQVDGLMAVRLTGVDEEQVYHPPTYTVPYPYYYTWDTYYPYMHERTGMPGYTATYKYYNVETNVYSANTEKLVWSAASQTVDPTNINKEAQAFARKIVSSLKASGLI